MDRQGHGTGDDIVYNAQRERLQEGATAVWRYRTDTRDAGLGWGRSGPSQDKIRRPDQPGWTGASGTTFFIDPKQRLIIIIMIQVPVPANSFTDERFATCSSSSFRFRLEKSNRRSWLSRRRRRRHPTPKPARVVASEFRERRRAGNSIRHVIVTTLGMRDGIPANRAGATLKPNDLA
jgi:CubicO group peptidase (beta-lactamase class C family)